MLDKIHPKYTLRVIPKVGKPYNYVHEQVTDKIATVIDLTVGKRGWIAYKVDSDWGEGEWHRITTSPIEKVTVGDNGEIEFVTRNTLYFLTPLAQR